MATVQSPKNSNFFQEFFRNQDCHGEALNTNNWLIILLYLGVKNKTMTAFNHPEEQNNQQPEANNHLQQQSKHMNQEKKSIFGSKTFWGVVFTSTAAIAPIIGNNVDTIVQKNGTVDYGKDAAQIVVIVCGAAASIIGRVEAKSPVYTPKWLPGPSNTDFDSEELS